MKVVILVLAVLCALATQATAATCPFDVPVITIAPHQVGGYSWGNVIRPLNDPCIFNIQVDPSYSAAWYAGGFNGVYMTKNHGQTWTKPLSGNVSALHLVRDQPQLVYAAIANRLYLTRDSGTTWTLIKTFPVSQSVSSLLVSGGTLYIGVRMDNHVEPSGIYVSSLGGGFMTFKPFGGGHTGVIVWTIARDAASGTLYAGGEIFDHPQPYVPPFFRSNDNGDSWTDLSGTLPWHAIDSDVRPDGYVYAITEGLGVYGSPNQGSSWFAPASNVGLGVSLLMHPTTPTRLFAGRQKTGNWNGGIYESTNSGQTFQNVGLNGATVSDIALNGARTRIYAAVYGSGIYVSSLP